MGLPSPTASPVPTLAAMRRCGSGSRQPKRCLGFLRRHEGGAIPKNDDVEVPFKRVLIWALATAVVASLVDVAVQQGMARWAEQPQGELPA